MLKKILFLFLVELVLIHKSYSWNSLGHRLVAQIAYNHLTPRSKAILNAYNHGLDKYYRPQNLVNSAVWLDSLRYQNKKWLGVKHYIGLPFSWDGTPLKKPNRDNAVLAITQAQALLSNKKISNYEKGFTLRILLHIVGDIHQPLHAANQFSSKHPHGDQGGNLFPLKANPVARNLHAYWDKGGGFLDTSKPYSAAQLRKKAASLEKLWPCTAQKLSSDPNAWAHESHQLALQKAYQIQPGEKPSKLYQKMAQNITKQRIAIAGCRLALLLNNM